MDLNNISGYLLNYRLGFLERYADSNLIKLLSLPFPLNEFALMGYSFLGVFPFFVYLLKDIPKSIIRFPEAFSSIFMFFIIAKTYIYSFILRKEVKQLIMITTIFLIMNIEVSLRRQMIVFPLFIEVYFILKKDIVKVNFQNNKIINILLSILYLFLILIYYVLL